MYINDLLSPSILLSANQIIWNTFVSSSQKAVHGRHKSTNVLWTFLPKFLDKSISNLEVSVDSQRTQERVLAIHNRWTISVLAIETSLCYYYMYSQTSLYRHSI